jgi:hypothetical protein
MIQQTPISEKQGIIRSKQFIKNFFVGRGFYFNPEITYIQQSPQSYLKTSFELEKKSKDESITKPNPSFYSAFQNKTLKYRSFTKNSSIKLLNKNKSLKNISLKLEYTNTKSSYLSIENDFDSLLEVLYKFLEQIFILFF